MVGGATDGRCADEHPDGAVRIDGRSVPAAGPDGRSADGAPDEKPRG